MSDVINYRFLGRTADGLLAFEDLDFPGDCAQHLGEIDPSDKLSSEPVFRYGKFFAVTDRHAEVHGLLRLVYPSTKG